MNLENTIDKTSKAEQDLINIWWYIAENNQIQADILVEKFDELFRAITENPNVGRNREELEEGIKTFPLGNYIIFYKINSNSVEIVRILHAARDINSDFFNENV